MADITKVDKNFLVQTQFDTSSLALYNVLEEPFRIYGVIPPKDEADCYRRMPEEVAKAVSEGVAVLATNTAGGRVRFRTNSTQVAVFAKMKNIGKMSHFPLTGSAGFDMYADNVYIANFVPPFTIEDGYSSIRTIDVPGEKTITIHFPLYSDLVSLWIGLDKDATLTAPEEYGYDAPIVYYGSSVTQGGCASRPGNAYQAIISRRLNCDHINLGFSGSAKGEDAMAEYISNLKMKAFVYDYDHNAPTPEHLKKTHEKMFKTIRGKHPELPIIMASMPRTRLTNEVICRREVVKRTYERAVAAGDKNVYFIDGYEMLTVFGDDGGTVDVNHPNDHGFAAMAKVFGDVLAKTM